MVERARRAAAKRAEVIRHAVRQYHAGAITLADLMRTIGQMRR